MDRNKVFHLEKYNTVIFDLFHTLSSMYHSQTPGIDTHKIFGVPKSDWLNAVFNKSGPRLKGEITGHYEIIESIVRQLPIPVVPEQIKTAAKSRFERFKLSLTQVLPNTLNTLRVLKSRGKKLALLSNADIMEKAGWDGSPLSGLIDNAVFSCDTGYIKPQNEIYKYCLSKIGSVPRETLYVADGSNSELEGARAAGMDTVFTSEFLLDLYPEKVSERMNDGDFHITNINQLIYNL